MAAGWVPPGFGLRQTKSYVGSLAFPASQMQY